MYLPNNFRPSSVGAENAKSTRFITMPKKKFVLKKFSFFIDKKKQNFRRFTEHNRVISLRFEHDDDQDEPKFERFHKAFCSILVDRRFRSFSLDRDCEPEEKRTNFWIKKNSTSESFCHELDERYARDNSQERCPLNLRGKNTPERRKKQQLDVSSLRYFCFAPKTIKWRCDAQFLIDCFSNVFSFFLFG